MTPNIYYLLCKYGVIIQKSNTLHILLVFTTISMEYCYLKLSKGIQSLCRDFMEILGS